MCKDRYRIVTFETFYNNSAMRLNELLKVYLNK